jgi:formylglycine-generating enzyme required for sulfatase activity
MTRVFISYRRDDSADVTGRIFDHLHAHFGQEVLLFRDVDVIPFGADFRKVIRQAVEGCQVLLAVIGPTWVGVTDATGTRRLDDSRDFVRLEIEAALSRDVPVIPVLVGKARMPREEELPESLRPIVYRHGIEVRRDPDFKRDVETLIRGLGRILKTPADPVAPPPTAAPPTQPGAQPTPKAGDRFELLLPGNVRMAFAWCPPGTFMMGSEKGSHDEQPVHKVTLTKGFYMGVSPVTQAQWVAVMGSNPSQFKGPVRPVEQVIWDDCQAFCEKLRQATGKQVRLPSEAQWEYACRAGTTSEYYTGDEEAALQKAGWYRLNAGGETHPVEKLAANAWGLFDMHGNVWEWCQDCYAAYAEGDQTEPSGLRERSDGHIILRGGSWFNNARVCRAANRSKRAIDRRLSDCGFRTCFHLD